jgi:hypothetical protein
LDITVICARRRNKNFNPNIIVVNKVVIDEPKRYKPQPTSHTYLLLNVIIERIPLISPATIKIIVNAKLILMING